MTEGLKAIELIEDKRQEKRSGIPIAFSLPSLYNFSRPFYALI